MAKKKSKSEGGGLSVRTFGGLNKSRYTKGTGGDRVILKQGDTVSVQFLAPIDDASQWKEINQHVFQEGKRWNYVPCLGDDCPLCDDEDSDVRKTSYRFFTNVFNFKTKKIEILEGPKDLSGRIAYKYEKNKKRFTQRVFEISKLATTPVSYDVDLDEERRAKSSIDTAKAIDLDEYLNSQAVRYFGDDMPAPGKKSKGKKRTALDDDDVIEDEYDEDELEEMEWSDLKQVATSLGIKLKDKEGNKRKRPTLIKLIIKKQG